MKKFLSSRVLLVTVLLIIGLVLLGQNMGIADSRPPAKTTGTDSTVAASPPQLDWALAGLLAGGALITLLRPRRRKTVPVTVTTK
jgi:hypothetical protein